MHGRSARKTSPDVRLSRNATFTVFGLFIIIALGAGLAFNVITVALPKLIDERAGQGMTLVAVGGIATAVFVVGGIAQLAVGRLVERFHTARAVRVRDADPVHRHRVVGGGAPGRCCWLLSRSPWPGFMAR